MKIQFTPQYYALNSNKPKFKSNKQTNNNVSSNSYNPIAYQDYNVSFGARTPENFYEFNAESMPYSMRNYLNYDKEQRQHIPPEQMMNEVFKRLDKAKNFEEVKTLYYPDEDLFKNLHPLRKNSRKGILSEIKVARDLSDTPLLKDGSDDFGMYLLKKIYKEGKTLKEISKDFLEKDINAEYKGFITEPITYETTAAYGIKFPNNGFWHSFISTREEYKQFFITLPKNMVDPNRTAVQSKSGSSSSKYENTENSMELERQKKPERKYKIQKYKKDQIKREIKSVQGDIDGVEKAVRKRFSKDDPEASFILKYLSPIMTVAADKIHLSEEMKYFYEFDDGNKQIGKSKIDRFWKTNPELLENYSTAITDTIELFEEVYGAGGLIPINNTFETITSKTENQKAIDYVTPEFIDLLDYTQRIKPLRDKRYAQHEEEQIQWETHFKERYGEVNSSESKKAEPVGAQEVEINVDRVQEAMNKAAAENPGVKFYDFMLDNGTRISFAVNLEEVLKDRLNIEYCNMPKSFVNKYSKFFLKHPKATEKLLLSLACANKDAKEWGDMLTPEKYSQEELDEINEQIRKKMSEELYSLEEVSQTMLDISRDFEQQNPQYMDRVKHSVMEYSTKFNAPDGDYLKKLIDERYRQMDESGLIPSEMSNEERLATYSGVYKQALEAINAMKSHNIVYLGTRSLEAGLSFLRIGNPIEDYGAEMDKILKKYTTPLSNGERSKIQKVFMNIMLNMDTNKTETFKNSTLGGFYNATVEVLRTKEYSKYKKEFTEVLNRYVITPNNTTLRYLIDPEADKNLKEAKVEIEISKLMQNNMTIFKKLASVDKDIMDKYIVDAGLYQQLAGYRFQNTN